MRSVCGLLLLQSICDRILERKFGTHKYLMKKKILYENTCPSNSISFLVCAICKLIGPVPS